MESNAFDYHGLTTEQRLLAFGFARGRRFFPGWDATLVDLPTEVLVSEQRSRQMEGLWLREPGQFLHDALPRARDFLDRFGDIRRRFVVQLLVFHSMRNDGGGDARPDKTVTRSNMISPINAKRRASLLR